VWLALALALTGAVRASAPTADLFQHGQERGFVLGWADETKDEAYFAGLANTGANLGRVFLQIPRDPTGTRFVLSESKIAVMQRIIDLASARHINLVIVGDFAGVDQPEFWHREDLKTSFVSHWRLMARTFGTDPTVVGFDLLNEPNPQSPTDDLAEKQAQWRALAERAIAAIRAEHVSTPIVFESIAGGAALFFKNLQPLADPQVVYSFHFYSPLAITHQHVHPEWNRTIPYPAGPEWALGRHDPDVGITAIDKRRLLEEMRYVIAFQQRYHRPIYVGEFSCVRWAPDHAAERYVGDLLAIFDQYQWSWTYHEFRGWTGWDAENASADPQSTARSSAAPVITLLRNALNRSGR
jgi:hypothetical protein